MGVRMRSPIWIVLAGFYFILSLVSFKTYISVKDAEIKIKIYNKEGKKYFDLKNFFMLSAIINIISFCLAAIAAAVTYFL